MDGSLTCSSTLSFLLFEITDRAMKRGAVKLLAPPPPSCFLSMRSLISPRAQPVLQPKSNLSEKWQSSCSVDRAQPKHSFLSLQKKKKKNAAVSAAIFICTSMAAGAKAERQHRVVITTLVRTCSGSVCLCVCNFQFSSFL